MHLAIVGDGYMLAEDKEGSYVYFRRCVLSINAKRKLCLRFGKGELRTDPMIIVPVDCDEIRISTNGKIDAISTKDKTYVAEIGHLTLALVQRKVALKEVELGIYRSKDEEKERVIPHVVKAGETYKLFLMQGWLEGKPK